MRFIFIIFSFSCLVACGDANFKGGSAFLTPGQEPSQDASQGQVKEKIPAQANDDTDTEEDTCKDLIGIDAERLVIAGSLQVLDLQKSAAYNLHVAGNQNQVKLALGTGTGAIPGVCLFVSGNNNQLDVTLTGTLDKLRIKATGNAARIHFEVPEGSAIGGMELITRGNLATIELTGAGAFSCSTVDAKDPASIICQ